MRRLGLTVVCLLVLLAGALPSLARADGDPGSDVLVYQNLFVGADDNLSTAQELALGRLLNATTALHAPVRVAIIGHAADLGTVTALWGQPAAYARYLGTELELAYSGRLVVVMPQGIGFFWYRHVTGASITHITTGPGPAALTAAAQTAVREVEVSAGVAPAALARAARSATLTQRATAAAATAPSGLLARSSAASAAGSEPTAAARARTVSPWVIAVGLLVILGAVFWAPALWRRRRGLARGRALLSRGGIAVPGLALGLGALGALVVLAVVVHSSGAQADGPSALATNPFLTTGTSLGDRPAPNFRLTDETGQSVSLRQYRGKVVLLSFTDDECQTICPLTTQAMVDAKRSLGPAGKDVQLLGVNANWRSTQIQDVAAYTQLHGLIGQWHFLTGRLAQLQRVWDAYGVGGDINARSNLIDHTPALFVIDPQGRLRQAYLTYSSYAAIGQFGQELAQEASRLLPGHPPVSTHFSYAPIRGIAPNTPATLPRYGGGTVRVGTGGPHLYLFFASWDQQSTPIRAEMESLNAYARLARRRGLPPITAVDEASVEPGPQALRSFLAGMHLDYPVAIDTTGRLADGYGVTGEPWFVLAVPGAHDTTTDPTATTPWTQEIYTQGWPTLKTLASTIPAALKPAAGAPTATGVARALTGSPPALAALHRQASDILTGGGAALVARLRALRGHPVVVNVWASTCAPCQQEFPWFATESARYGKHVAFLGVDYDDASQAAALGFLARHHVSYPSYAISSGSVPAALLPGGVEGTPTTIFFNAAGQRTYIQIGEYSSEQQLAAQISGYATG